MKPRPERRGEIQVQLVQHLDESAAGIDALNEVGAIDNRPGRSFPFATRSISPHSESDRLCATGELAVPLLVKCSG